MNFTTEVGLPSKVLDINHTTGMMLMGSCFAQNIGERLLRCKFRVDVNPFGILYNPLSVSAALERILDGAPFCESSPLLVQNEGLWHSLLHHGCFSSTDKNALLTAVNGRLSAAHDNVASLDVLVLTLGTAYVYRLADEGVVVGNCHKLPASMFRRSLLCVDEVCDSLGSVLARLFAIRPSCKVLFTVSPIRHLRDGAHDNQVSKATLLLAVEELRRRFPDNTAYFPAYEIMLDELRDYRFYADDMVHPSTLAVEYLWGRFSECFFSPSTREACKEVEDVARALAHRPVNPGSDAHRNFLSKILLKIEAVQRKHPYFDFENEKQQCNIP